MSVSLLCLAALNKKNVMCRCLWLEPLSSYKDFKYACILCALNYACIMLCLLITHNITGLRSSTIDSAKKERHQKKMQAAARHRREQLQQALEVTHAD
eukprot:1153646-Pelagomonas_calceolata.AAC.2